MEYGSLHQEELDGLLASLATKEVRESVAATAGLEDLMQMQSRTGVIYASTRAKQWGFKGPGDPDWGNLGQGAPETSPVPNQPPRISKVDLEDEQGNEYSDVNGRKDLRQAIADYYNFFFRQGKASQYTYENVCVTGGGRSGLNRLMGSLQNINVGYTTPDYTAYSQLLGEFVGISPIPVAHDDPEGLLTTAPELRKQIRLHGLGAFLLSNPGNPTGKPIEGGLLDKYVRIAREENCLFLMDEFYSHYMYEAQAS
jgi:aspartate/methionine/tyrosine aminotransferase